MGPTNGQFWFSMRAAHVGSKNDNGMLIAVIRPSSRPAVPGEKPASRYTWANQPKTEYACNDWNPKNRARPQPRRVRATAPSEMEVRSGSGAVSWRSRPNHGRAATAAVTAHANSPQRQEPNASESGTVSPEARVSPMASAVVYTDVSSPTRCGKCSLTSEGSSTLAVAMPASATTESSRNSPTSCVLDRRASPATTASRAIRVTRCRPVTRASQGARAPNPAKARTGSVVSTPAVVGDIRSPEVISSSTGPTLTAAGRRLNPSTTMPTTTSTRSARVSGGGAVCSSPLIPATPPRRGGAPPAGRVPPVREQPEQQAPPVQRLRVRYAKRGRLRFTSHRDFSRAFERAVVRARVPMAYSSGFNPHPRISYAGASPTGAASEAEYLEIGLAQESDPAEVLQALDAALPPGLDVLEVVTSPGGSLADLLEASAWRTTVPDLSPETGATAVETFLAS